MENQNYSFRSALNGFHRGDVIAYLAKLSASHEAALREKDEMIRVLREELAEAKQTPAVRVAAPVIAEAEPVRTADDELEVYRRAERCEREARARAEKLYSDASGTVEAMGRKIADRQTALDSAADALSADFDVLQAAIAGILDEVEDARSALSRTEQTQSED